MKKAPFLLIFPILIICFSCAELNNILHNVNTTTKTLQGTANGLKGLSNSVKGLTNTLKLTKTEFDKTVTVFKSGSSATKRSSIPKGKESKLEIKKGKTKDFEWDPIAHFDNQLFPSVIISMATYKQPVVGSLANSIRSNALGFSYTGKKSFVPVKFEIESTENTYFNKCSGEFIYLKAGQTEIFMPEIAWKFDALTKQYTNKPIKIYYRIFDEKGNKAERLETITLRSIDDCIYSYNGYDMKFMFAAYVQEQHPEIDIILREALNTKIVKEFLGYQKGEVMVENQIAAIWAVLHNRGFVYSSITDNAGDKGKVVSQAVRTFDSCIKTSQANCVDGTLVFASILKRIGIYPLLTMVEGHCFLGYYYYPDGSKQPKIKFLETTKLGESGNLDRLKTLESRNKEYKRLFKVAQSTGYQEYIYHLNNKGVQLIDINEERKRVDPIPYYK